MSNKKRAAKNWKNPNFVANAGAETIGRSLLLGGKLRDTARRGPALGTFLIELPDPATLTVLSLAGFDFVVLDMEHSTIDFGRLEILINAGRAAGIAMLVRPWGEDTGLIGKVLDIGAHGIMAPRIGTAERARDVTSQARFAPGGERGFSPLTRYAALKEPLNELDDSTIVVVQIEGKDALANVKEIAAVPGVDAVFVGPYDLALSLDVPPGSPEVIAAAEQIAKSVGDDTILGIYIDDPQSSGRWADRGFSLQCVSFDSRMLSIGARSVVDAARNSQTK
jgi:2-keto-3-deoxy-L-rhamnonate aldolase RhmA